MDKTHDQQRASIDAGVTNDWQRTGVLVYVRSLSDEELREARERGITELDEIIEFARLGQAAERQARQAAQQERPPLEDVLDAFVASGAGPNSASLHEWIRRYPKYERDLTEFAASWSLMKWLPPSPDAEEVDEKTLVLRGMSVVQNLLHKQLQAQRGTDTAYRGDTGETGMGAVCANGRGNHGERGDDEDRPA